MVVLMLIDAGIFTTIGLPLRSCLTTFSALVIPSVFHVLRTITIYCGIEMIEFSLLVYQDHQFYQFMSNLIDSSLNKFEFTLIYGRLKRAMPFFLFLIRKKKGKRCGKLAISTACADMCISIMFCYCPIGGP